MINIRDFMLAHPRDSELYKNMGWQSFFEMASSKISIIQSNAIRQIDAHVEQKPQTDYTRPGNSSHNNVNKNCGIRMQRVRINAATVGIVNGTCQQVVKINNHGQCHDKPRLQPSMLEEKNCCETGYQKVKGYMNRRIEHELEFEGREEKNSRPINSACGPPCYQALKWINTLASCPSISGLFSIQFNILQPSASPDGAEQLMYGITGSPAIDL